MANDRRDQKPEIAEKMRQAPVSEAEVDELRASGRGFEPGAQDTPEVRRARGGNPSAGRQNEESNEEHRQRMLQAEREAGSVSRRAHGGAEQVAGHQGLNEREGAQQTHRHASTGDESRIVQRRAEGRFESEGERSQVEEDFGERGLRLPDHFDNRNTRSILDPEDE